MVFLKAGRLISLFKFYPIRHLTLSVQMKAKLFSDKHEWIEVDKNVGTVGISDYAQEKLGDIVYVQLPEVGSKIKQYDECGTVESVKAASELYSPVSGEISEVNKRLERESGLLNKSPYTDGWLFKILLTKPEELNGLMSEKAYEKFLEEDSG